MAIEEGSLLWSPSDSFVENANISQFMRWLASEKGVETNSYDEIWQWSVGNLETFWASVWDYFNIATEQPYSAVLADKAMPGADWFPGSSVNFSEHVLRNRRDDAVALYAYSELEPARKVDWDELDHSVRVLAQHLRKIGVKPGDRVVSYLPNIPETVIVLLASASVGAIFSSCSPDFGYKSVIDRFSQIEPKVLFYADGYRFGGKDFDRQPEVTEIVHSLPSLDSIIEVSYLNRDRKTPIIGSALFWADVMDESVISLKDFSFERVPFAHPLWVLYSSGTTGLPKPIVHSQGGIVLEFMKLLSFHMNLGPESTMFFYTSTGWMMWNLVVGALITGASSVLYEGNPMGNGKQPETLWTLAEDSGTTFFGTSPTFIALMEKQGFSPKASLNMDSFEGILLGGSPAPPDVMGWCYENIKQDLWVTSQSGGTDICSAFVGASPTLPVYAGEIQTRCLGVDAHAFNDDAKPVLGSVGELVIRQPMPSMPIYFWNDKNNERYRGSYFEDFQGVWRQGDYFLVNERGGCYIYGRSDSTLNRYGVRIGTAEIYRVVEVLDEIEDSLIVNLSLDDGKFLMPLFVTLKGGQILDEPLRKKICSKLKAEYSPRHVPDKIIQVEDIPYTLTNKKMEVPVRKILSGVEVAKAANIDAMRNPAAIHFFVTNCETIVSLP
ncbi:MAG: acetoacetate--CoA ligase [Alteromonadaceae bacterium TMED7]|nr:MAG: acetoacetate--CoA ligase [Alteromonadaceae bacterium TMED7]|tara:strand:- start:2606 stop:4603 length:1998 start_codon:yes stop_codon:yes gene_type:complete